MEELKKEETIIVEEGPQAELVAKKDKLDWKTLVLPGSILLAAVMISGSLLYVNSGGALFAGKALIEDGAPGEDVPNGPAVAADVDDDAILGNPDAKVTIIEFSDYQCPFCRRFWTDTLPQLKSQYIDTGKVRLVYRDFPLTFHPMAQPSAEAAECAGDQDKYWQMHDKIFAEQVKLGDGTVQYTLNDLKRWGGQIGLNTGEFNSCLDSRKHQAEVEKDFAAGGASGVSGTPSFFVNGKLIVGAQPFAQFQQLIDSELK